MAVQHIQTLFLSTSGYQQILITPPLGPFSSWDSFQVLSQQQLVLMNESVSSLVLHELLLNVLWCKNQRSSSGKFAHSQFPLRALCNAQRQWRLLMVKFEITTHDVNLVMRNEKMLMVLPPRQWVFNYSSEDFIKCKCTDTI